jgi:hypothetical protein
MKLTGKLQGNYLHILHLMFCLLLFSVSVGILYLCTAKSEEWERENPRPMKASVFVLVWTKFFNEDVMKSVFGLLTKPSVHDLGCPKVDCVVTAERGSVRDVDVVVFNQEDTNV